MAVEYRLLIASFKLSFIRHINIPEALTSSFIPSTSTEIIDLVTNCRDQGAADVAIFV
ncbi:hypothetical protein ACU8KH_00365 [Lachancea thermotolerans]